MALEAIVFQQDVFGYNLLGGNWGCEFSPEEEERVLFETPPDDECQTENYHYLQWGRPNSSSEQEIIPEEDLSRAAEIESPNTAGSRQRRRRSKNKEEMENQRMNHIAVERNRRKQMNDYLSMLRSLMPHSYVQKSDQASIVTGAINYVKELEQKLQFFGSNSSELPFSEFFTFPQYSMDSGHRNSAASVPSVLADIEATMVESHANLKIRSIKRPKQLLKIVSGLQSLRLSILHLNVTTVDQFVLYSLSLKVEDECELSSVDEIATAVHQILARIQEETILIGKI